MNEADIKTIREVRQISQNMQEGNKYIRFAANSAETVYSILLNVPAAVISVIRSLSHRTRLVGRLIFYKTYSIIILCYKKNKQLRNIYE